MQLVQRRIFFQRRIRISARWKSAGLFAVGQLLLLLSCGFAQTPITLEDSVEVNVLTITGNESFDDRTLRERLNTKQSPGSIAIFLASLSERLPFAEPAQYFDNEYFQQDLELLRQFYKNNGFFSARVEGSLETLNDRKAVKVTFTIQEGQVSYIDSVQYRNIAKLPQDILDELQHGPLLLKGNRYNAETVTSEIQRILKILRNSGFPRAFSDSVLVERRLSDNNVLVRLPFYFGKMLYFGSLRDSTQGADELNLARKIIYDRLDFKEGDLYSVDQRERAETNLNRMGLFSSVQLAVQIPPLTDTVTQVVPVTIILASKNRHELDPGLLVNNQFNRFNLGAEASYLFRNVFGGAQTFTSKISYLGSVSNFTSSFQSTAQVRLDQPYLIDNSNSAFWSVSFILYKEPSELDGNIVQNMIGVRRRFSGRVQAYVDWTLEQSKFNFIKDSAALAASPFASLGSTGDFRNSILSVSLERDYTDEFFNPSSGLYVKGTAEEAGLLKRLLPGIVGDYKSTEYWKLEGTARYFADLSKNKSTIFGLKLKMGGIFRYGESKTQNISVPPNRKYYAGGTSSIRGWQSRHLSVNGEEKAKDGGNALIETSAELRWQLFPGAKKWLAVEPQNIWLVFFADAGNLWNEIETIRLNETAIAFGFGFRYNLFFGPIRVDWGMRAYDPNDISHPWFYQQRFFSDVFLNGIFQLGIGHAF